MRDVQGEISRLVSDNPIVLFMKGTPKMPLCGFSARTAAILEACGVAFESVNVLADPEIREGVKEFGKWPTVPQLYVRGKLVGGCDITIELFKTGELAPMLQAAAADGPQPGIPPA